MRHTRRSTRISYVEPTVDDFMDEIDDDTSKMTIDEIENQPIAIRNKLLMEQSTESTPIIDEEEDIVIKPRTRNLRINSHRDNLVDNTTMENDMTLSQDTTEFNWEDYISEDTSKHLKKYNLPDFPIGAEKLVQNWKYQFFVAFCNNVCQSYVTTVLYSIKPLWRDIKFDEIILLYELFNHDHESTIISDKPEDRLYNILKLKILRQFTNDKKVNLNNWDDKIQPFFSYEGEFTALQYIEQFDILYQMVKIMELKNVNMKNYIINHMEIFQYPEYYKDDNTQIIILPNFGTIIERTKLIPNYSSSNENSNEKNIDYLVPIKLSNCTINYNDIDPINKDITNLIHLDYSQEIDSYLQSIKIEYSVKSFNWLTFIDYLKNSNNFEIRSFCEIKLTQLLYSSQLIKQRLKQHEVDELMTRRKRSSRLIAREEETKKAKISDLLSDKINARDQFLKFKQRPIQRYHKKLKEIIWNQLWYNFDVDWKKERTNRRSEDKLPGANEKLTQLDWDVINRGMNFNTRIFVDDLKRDLNKLVVIGKEDNISTKTEDDIRRDEEDVVSNSEAAEASNDLGVTNTVESINETKIEETHSTSLIPSVTTEAENILELPIEYCITEEDLAQSWQTNINMRGVNKCDNLNWLFQCTCLPEMKELQVIIDRYNKNHDNKVSSEILERAIVCCNECNVWTHWDCQTTDTIYWLGQIQNKPQQFTQDDFSTVTIHPSHRSRKHGKRSISMDERSQPQRRSTRLKEEYEHKEVNYHDNDYDNDDDKDISSTANDSIRPRDRIDHNRLSISFMCNHCLSQLEDEMRSQFIPELVLVRERQLKSRRDRERRKLKKTKKENATNDSSHSIIYSHSGNINTNTAITDTVQNDNKYEQNPTNGLCVPITNHHAQISNHVEAAVMNPLLHSTTVSTASSVENYGKTTTFSGNEPAKFDDASGNEANMVTSDSTNQIGGHVPANNVAN